MLFLDQNQSCSTLKQFPPINPQIMFKTNMDSKPSKSAINVQICNFPNKKNSKLYYHIILYYHTLFIKFQILREIPFFR